MSKMNKNWILTFMLAVLVGVGACASPAPGTNPDDMSVAEHQEHARAHQEAADEHQKQHDPAARNRVSADPTTELYAAGVYNPTERHLIEDQQHQRHADQHSQAAQSLLNYKEEHCAKFPDATRASCPLMGQVKAVEDIDGGVRITFHDDVPREAAVEHMQCHFAFARTQGYEGMDSCPLYLEGISVEAEGEGQSVKFTTNKPESVEALRTQTRDHLTGHAEH